MSSKQYEALNRIGTDWIDRSKSNVTLIIGANCKDGVVLVADKKVVEGGEVTIEDKIRLVTPLGIGFSGAGLTDLFDKFLTHVIIQIDKRTNENKLILKQENPNISEEGLSNAQPYKSPNEFIEDCEGILFKLRETYKDVIRRNRQGLSAIIAFRTPKDVELHLIDTPSCMTSRRKTFVAIGSGSPYAQTFLKEIWDKNMTMKEMARLGHFIIRYIEIAEVDLYVGKGTQVLFIPTVDPSKYSRYNDLLGKQNKSKEEENELDAMVIKFIDGNDPMFKDIDRLTKEFKDNFQKLKSKLNKVKS